MIHKALLSIPLAIALLLPVAASASHPAAPAGHNAKSTSPAMALHDEMRRLWQDHVVWTRMFVVSAVANLPDQQAVTTRLLQNQADIGNAVAVYYGREAGARLTTLLREHILIAADLVAAAKKGDQAKVASENDRWQQNADDIATFLHGANPKHWPTETIRTSMNMHLQQTLEEATSRLRGNWTADVKVYDEIVQHILMMADVLSDGIVAQFPQKFASGR